MQGIRCTHIYSGAGHRSAQSGMGNGHHLHADGQGLHVPGCHHGLGQPKSTQLALETSIFH